MMNGLITMNDEQPTAEPVDLRQAITDYAQQLRDDYIRRLHESTPWVLPPRIYDEAARQIGAGTAKPETIAIMRNAVRAEYWTEETTS